MLHWGALFEVKSELTKVFKLANICAPCKCSIICIYPTNQSLPNDSAKPYRLLKRAGQLVSRVVLKP